MADTTELAALLAHADWLRKLARMLVGPSAADDAVQDTYVAALRSPPDPALPARPWLSRVMRNATRMAHRGSTRRARREDVVATFAEAGARADDAVARAETFRLLVELVLALGEPYRTVLVRHYFDGDTFAEIARRDGVPEATVRGRHKHALEQLRTQLDARGDRRAWLAALAPIAAPPTHATSVTTGVLVMNKILIGTVVVAVAAGGAVWWLYPHGPGRLSGSGSSAALAPVAQAPESSHTIDSATTSPTQHVRQLASAERQQLAERIATAQAVRAKRKQAATPTSQSDQAPPSSSGSAHEADMDKEVIRGAMREVLPFLGDCYGEARESTLAADHLAIHAKLKFTGDRDVGTIIDAQKLVDDEGHALPVKLDDCLRGTLQTLELPPLGDGDTIDVDYPLLFSDGPDGSGSGSQP
jgi:RNA polymerase sigma-70 factor (ECF subfamily)